MWFFFIDIHVKWCTIHFFSGVETQFCHNILQPSLSPYGEMLPPQRKEGESILEQKEKAKRPEILNNNFMWKSPPQLIKQHQVKGSDGTLLEDLQKSVFDSERQKHLKWRQTFSPEITEMQRRTQDLPSHKVYVLAFLSFTNCLRFCLIVSWIETPWLQGTCSFN